MVFRVFWVEGHGGTRAKRLKRGQVVDFFARLAPVRVAMEARGGAHYWRRELERLGHEVMLIHPKYVRAFVKTNKTDAADARAIWTAARQPEMRTVPVKTTQQQAVLALHRVRENRRDMRAALMNPPRGLLAQFGVVLKRGRQAGLAESRQEDLAGAGGGLPQSAEQATRFPRSVAIAGITLSS